MFTPNYVAKIVAQGSVRCHPIAAALLHDYRGHDDSFEDIEKLFGMM